MLHLHASMIDKSSKLVPNGLPSIRSLQIPLNIVFLCLMNILLKNGLLCVGFGIATYFSIKLWALFPYPNILNLISLILSGILLIVAVNFFAKIFVPKAKFIELVFFFLVS